MAVGERNVCRRPCRRRSCGWRRGSDRACCGLGRRYHWSGCCCRDVGCGLAVSVVPRLTNDQQKCRRRRKSDGEDNEFAFHRCGPQATRSVVEVEFLDLRDALELAVRKHTLEHRTGAEQAVTGQLLSFEQAVDLGTTVGDDALDLLGCGSFGIGSDAVRLGSRSSRRSRRIGLGLGQKLLRLGPCLGDDVLGLGASIVDLAIDIGQLSLCRCDLGISRALSRIGISRKC